MEIKEVYAELICEVCNKSFPTSKRCFKNRKPICRVCSNRQAQLNRSEIRKELKKQKESLVEKVCKKCQLVKSIEFFQKQYYKDGSSCIRHKCIECCNEEDKLRYLKNKTEGKKLSWNKSSEAYISKLFYKASQRNKEFSIEKEYVISLFEKQNGLCAISGEKLTFDKDNVSSNISIDRINSNLGYVEGNVQLVCAHVNIMKWNKSTEELIEWCEKIISNIKNGK
jgi:hypothetical protein